MLTKRQLAVLRMLFEADRGEDDGIYPESEIVADGRHIILGLHKLSRGTVNALLRVMAISEENWGGGTEIYTINDCGREIVRNPAFADEVRAAINRGKNFTIKDGKIVEI